MEKSILTMKLLKGNYGVCRLKRDKSIPEWALKGDFFNITKTEDELSIVCDVKVIPQDTICEKNWRILKVEGPLDFALVGILAKISEVLADCHVSIFAISTYDTDYILIKEEDIEVGIEALRNSNYRINADL